MGSSCCRFERKMCRKNIRNTIYKMCVCWFSNMFVQWFNYVYLVLNWWNGPSVVVTIIEIFVFISVFFIYKKKIHQKIYWYLVGNFGMQNSNSRILWISRSWFSLICSFYSNPQNIKRNSPQIYISIFFIVFNEINKIQW